MCTQAWEPWLSLILLFSGRFCFYFPSEILCTFQVLIQIHFFSNYSNSLHSVSYFALSTFIQELLFIVSSLIFAIFHVPNVLWGLWRQENCLKYLFVPLAYPLLLKMLVSYKSITKGVESDLILMSECNERVRGALICLLSQPPTTTGLQAPWGWHASHSELYIHDFCWTMVFLASREDR